MAVRSFCPAPGAGLLLEVADGRGEISLGEIVTLRIFFECRSLARNVFFFSVFFLVFFNRAVSMT